jgi:hypothetical protein
MPSPLDYPESSTPSKTPEPDDRPAPRSADETRPLAIEYQQPDGSKGEVGDEEEVQTLDVGGGNVVKLDKLGPMIINSDGVSAAPLAGPEFRMSRGIR